MKLYTLSHAAYFEAACRQPFPSSVFLRWLVQDIPALPSYPKSSLDWLMLRSNAQPEELPDFCYGCHRNYGRIPGGNVRLVCPGCVEDDDPEADSHMNWFLEMQFILMDHRPEYFGEVIDYLLAVHAEWILTHKFRAPSVPEPIASSDVEGSLLDKLRTQDYAAKSGA
jgi:hypothetical protein